MAYALSVGPSSLAISTVEDAAPGEADGTGQTRRRAWQVRRAPRPPAHARRPPPVASRCRGAAQPPCETHLPNRGPRAVGGGRQSRGGAARMASTASGVAEAGMRPGSNHRAPHSPPRPAARARRTQSLVRQPPAACPQGPRNRLHLRTEAEERVFTVVLECLHVEVPARVVTYFRSRRERNCTPVPKVAAHASVTFHSTF